MDMRYDEFTVTVDVCKEINYVGWAHCFRYALHARTCHIRVVDTEVNLRALTRPLTSILQAIVMQMDLRPVTYQL